MTTNQTIDGVPRKLLSSLLAWLERANERNDDGDIAEYVELRALLDGPATGVCRGCFTEQPMGDACKTCAEVEAKRVAQPHGEPVAWQYRVSAGPQTGWSLWHDGKGEEFKQSYQVETRPLYAEQPAPVAVVLPDPDQLCDAIATALGEALDCTRVWSAWGVGTMSEDDFVPVSDQPERLHEIASACLEEVARVQGVKP